MTRIAKTSIILLLAGSAGAAPLPLTQTQLIPSVPPTEPEVTSVPWIFLDDYETNTDLLFRALGEVNFKLDDMDGHNGRYVQPIMPGGPHESDPTLFAALDPYKNRTFALPYGDRLGYAASGLGDVDGDGFNDWSTTWYDAQPYTWRDPHATLGLRVPNDAYVLPYYGDTTGQKPQNGTELRDEIDWDRVGMTRIYSGRTNQQIGAEIWGHSNLGKFPHEIKAFPDIDGDGRAEVILAANTSDGHRGSVNVMSYTNRYNAGTDTTERWVCIWRIVGKEQTSEIGYEVENNDVDLNGDGRVDLITSSKWWHVSGSASSNDTGGGWVFFTPPEELFEQIQQSSNWDRYGPERDNVLKPLEYIAEDDYNFCVMQLRDADTCGMGSATMPLDPENCPSDVNERVGTIGDLAYAGDLDADGEPDFAVTGYFKYPGAVGNDSAPSIYFLLSGGTGHPTYDGNSLPVNYTFTDTDNDNARYISYNDDPTQFPQGHTTYDRLTAGPNFVGVRSDAYQEADLVLYGDATRRFSNNLRSYFARNFFGTASTDMALVTFNYQNRSGQISIVKADDMFGTGGILNGATGQVQAHYSVLTSYDTLFIDGPTTYGNFANLSGMEIAGDFDGDGDDEIAVSLNDGHKVDTTNPNYAQVTAICITDLDTTTTTILQAIRNETPKYRKWDSTMLPGIIPDWLTGDPSMTEDNGVKFFGSGSMNNRGLHAERIPDVDRDGRDDLIIHTASTTGRVLHAPTDNIVPDTVIEIFDEDHTAYVGYRPMHVSGNDANGPTGVGSTYVLLSPANTPELESATSEFLLNGGSLKTKVTHYVKHISPATTSTTDNDPNENVFQRDVDLSDFTFSAWHNGVDRTADMINPQVVWQANTPPGVGSWRFRFKLPYIQPVDLKDWSIKIQSRYGEVEYDFAPQYGIGVPIL